jgi:hypothetical protein
VDQLAKRVARRFLLRTGGFIPDKFWREKKAELKKILTDKLDSNREVSWKIGDLLAFYKKFKTDLVNFGIHQFAEQSIDMRFSMIEEPLKEISASYALLDRAIDSVYPVQTVEDEIFNSITSKVQTMFEEKVPSLQIALKGVWKVDREAVVALAKKVLKKATPVEIDALERSRNNDYSRLNEKYGLFKRLNLDAAIKRLITIDKKALKVDPISWIDHLKDVLQTVYSEDKLDTHTQFELHGIKVVIRDLTVTPENVKDYVKYLTEAYHKLKAKRLDKVWYGTVYISCNDCGGVNYNTGGGVGGNYPIGPDVVNVFNRPSWFIVELMAHELGHRYWFKFMSQSQRGKFESLVRVHKKPKPTGKAILILNDAVRAAKEKVQAAAKAVRSSLDPLTSPFPKKSFFRDILKENFERVSKAGWTFYNDMLDAVHSAGASSTLNPTTKHAFDEMLTASSAVQRYAFDFDEDISKKIHSEPEPSQKPKSFDAYWMEVFQKHLSEWLDGYEEKIVEAVTKADKYIDIAVDEFNKAQGARVGDAWKAYHEEYETDERPVTPVSDYGKSNIDEAFAEVFAHYVLEYDMTRDQLDSFKSVLSSTQREDLFLTFLNLLS